MFSSVMRHASVAMVFGSFTMMRGAIHQQKSSMSGNSANNARSRPIMGTNANSRMGPRTKPAAKAAKT